MKNQCEAITMPSTYSAAHRCLKKGIKKLAGRRLCAHHLRGTAAGQVAAKLN